MCEDVWGNHPGNRMKDRKSKDTTDDRRACGIQSVFFFFFWLRSNDAVYVMLSYRTKLLLRFDLSSSLSSSYLSSFSSVSSSDTLAQLYISNKAQTSTWIHKATQKSALRHWHYCKVFPEMLQAISMSAFSAAGIQRNPTTTRCCYLMFPVPRVYLRRHVCYNGKKKKEMNWSWALKWSL